MMIRTHRIETRPDHNFGVIFGRDEHMWSVYVLEERWLCEQWATQLVGSNEPLTLDFPSHRIQRLP